MLIRFAIVLVQRQALRYTSVLASPEITGGCEVIVMRVLVSMVLMSDGGGSLVQERQSVIVKALCSGDREPRSQAIGRTLRLSVWLPGGLPMVRLATTSARCFRPRWSKEGNAAKSISNMASQAAAADRVLAVQQQGKCR
jgi:hypothetical protein